MTEESETVVVDKILETHKKANRKLSKRLLGNNKFRGLLVVILCGLIGGGFYLVKAATTSYSLWSNGTVPSTITSANAASVDLGVKFKSVNSGYVTGIRFYKGAQNTGTHIGSLWTLNGTLLASVTFTNETASGWQTANLSQPVAIAANVVYVVSYYAPNGHYSYNNNYFKHSYSSGPLDAIHDYTLSGANGVYVNCSKPTFPTQGLKSTNFWVDLVFSTQLVSAPVAPAPPTTVTATQNGSSIVVSWNAGISSKPIASYNVLRNGSQVVNVNSTTFTYTDTNITAGQTYNYQIETVDNTGAVSVASNTTSVTYNVTPTVATISASPTTVAADQSSTLTWSSTNATSCTASGAWSGSEATSGSVSTGALTATSTYTLSCTGPGGTNSTSATVAVTQPTTGTITTGNSKSNCIELNNPGGVMSDAELSAITAVSGVTYNCVITFANPAPAWTDWENPWPFRITSDGWDAWVAENPVHQVVLGMDLIPNAVTNNNDPLTWEQPCDAGDYNTYATQLGENLVADGAGNTVIRFGIEANGGWEIDYVGQTVQEQNAWAQCYDNEVTALRAVTGAHFLFVWNPNICTNDLAMNQWYPGNSYVDIIGADAYDVDCGTVKTVSQEGWTAYSTDSSQNNPNDPNFPSLANIEAFAVANGKTFALPEWGLNSSYPDDPTYVTDIGAMVENDNTAFESYFDCGCDSISPLGPTIPLATTAYQQAF